MTHFTALSRHGKLSVLGRVSPAAAPDCHASTKRELYLFPPTRLQQTGCSRTSHRTHLHVFTRALLPQMKDELKVTP